MPRLWIMVIALLSCACEPTAEGKAVSHWIQQAHNGSAEQQLKAAGIVARIGTPAVPYLLANLDRGPDAARSALTILGSMGSEANAAVPRLLQELARGGSDMRLEVAVTILQIDCRQTKETIPVLVQGLRAENPSVALAVTATGFLGAEGAVAVPSLVFLLATPDSDLRLRVVSALSNIGPPARAALPALREAESDLIEIAPSIQAAVKSIEGTGMSPFPTCAVRRNK